jgi:hypothetical protein
MNVNNETLATPAMMKQLREAGLDQGYEPVPRDLERSARRNLRGRALATMDKKFKSDIKKLKVKLGNARHENAVLRAKEKLRAEGMLK